MIADEVLAAGEEAPLERTLRDEVARRLGLPSSVPITYEGLRQVYAAWCGHVSFDNLRKVIALRTGKELPGRTAVDFFRNWLEYGTGGTCWPSSNALFALVRSYGFRATRAGGSMRDAGPMNHASIRVAIDHAVWLVDSSMLTVAPIRLSDGAERGEDPLFGAESEPDAGTHLVWADFPPNPSWLPCRLHPEPITRELHLEQYEASRTGGAFNGRVVMRRNFPAEKRALIGSTHVSKTSKGVVTRELTRDQLCAFLREEFGISDALVQEWVACGGLDVSYEPPGPKPPPVQGVPPSQR